MNQKLVSVCINCYNAEDTIERTLRSVLDQTHTALQVIVVDDASTDGTREILRRFDDERLTLCLLEQNGHISNANNEALDRCEGAFVAHLDADDVWEPDKLEKQLAFLEEHPEYGAVFSVVTPVDENDRPIEDTRFFVNNLPQAEMLRYLLEKGNFLCHSSMLARKEVIDRIGRHNVSLLYLHDFDYWVRMSLVCPFYVMEQPLVRYRIASNSNSNRDMTAERFGAHMVEHARIHYRTLVDCPDELFLKAFGDVLRRPDLSHTHEQVELEKAFVLLRMLTHLPQNPALGLRRMAELLNDASYREIAIRDFGLTAREFYRLQETVVFHNEAEATHYRNLLADYVPVKQALEAAQEHTRQLQNHIKNVEEQVRQVQNYAQAQAAAKEQFKAKAIQLEMTAERLEAQIEHDAAERAALEACIQATEAQVRQEQVNTQQVQAALEELHREMALVKASRWWRLVEPIRLARHRRRIKRILRHPLLTDGRPAKATVAVYGFFGHNVGDDLFLDRLFKRYPDTVFTVFDAENYEAFFGAYPNVYSYTRRHPDVLALETDKQPDAFERLVLSEADAVVHIGGSIYQQIGDWETDMQVRRKRYKRSTPFFSISSNFGPYHTEDYRSFWKKQFRKSADICFRETYSSSLFADVKAARFAPDLLFSQPLPAVPREDNRLFMSVIAPDAPHRSFTEKQCTSYYRLMSEVAKLWIQNGGTVNLAAFCPYEGDMQAMQTVKAGIPASMHGSIIETVYTSSVEAANAVIDALCRSSHVLATRFHAMVFGLTSGARTVPLCYSDKMRHVLDDLNFDGKVYSLRQLSLVTAQEVVDSLLAQQPFEAGEVREAAKAQFAKLDAFLTKKHAVVK